MPKFTTNPKLSNKFSKAMQTVFESHSLQIRKQGEVPYLAHLMAVSSLVLEAGGSEDEAIAALLHDIVEDILDNPESPGYLQTPYGCRDRQSSLSFHVAEEMGFGWNVWEIVDWCSAEGHQDYIENISKAPPGAVLVSCADKLHNLRSYTTDGRHLWKPDTAEFYSKLMPIYERCDRVPQHWIEEMNRLLAGIEQAMVTISKAELESLRYWADKGTDWDREFPDYEPEERGFEPGSILYHADGTTSIVNEDGSTSPITGV